MLMLKTLQLKQGKTMTHTDFLSYAWLQTYRLEKKLPALSRQMTLHYHDWHRMLEKPCYYLHDRHDNSKQLLNRQSVTVNLFSKLCKAYDLIQRELQTASTNQVRKLCHLFLRRTQDLHQLQSTIAIPETINAAIVWSRRHFLSCTRTIIHAARIQNKIKATLHFQILSVNLLRQPTLWNHLNHEWHLRQDIHRHQKFSSKASKSSAHQRRQLFQEYSRHLEHKPKIKLNYDHREEPEVPHYPRYPKPLPQTLNTLKEIATSPAFTLQLMSHHQLLDYGRQALHTLKVLNLYEKKIIAQNTNHSFHTNKALKDIQNKVRTTLTKANLTLEAMHYRLRVSTQQGLEISDPIAWIHEQLSRHKVPIMYDQSNQPQVRRVTSLSWIKDYYDFIQQFPYEDKTTLTIKARTISLSIFLMLPPLKQYSASNSIQRKLLYSPHFWQQVLTMKQQLQAYHFIDYEQLQHTIDSLKQDITHLFNTASFWQRHWGQTYSIYKKIYDFLDSILHEGATHAYHQEQENIKQNIKNFYKSLDTQILLCNEENILELLGPWIFSQAAMMQIEHRSILIESDMLAHHLAGELTIDHQHLSSLLDSSCQLFEQQALKQQQWINLIRSEWPQQEQRFAHAFIHNELMFTWSRLLNPWSSTLSFPTLEPEQQAIFSRTPLIYFEPVLFAACDDSMRYRETTQKKIDTIQAILGQNHAVVEQLQQRASEDNTINYRTPELIAHLEQEVTKNLEWILFHLAQQVALEHEKIDLSSEIVDLFSEILNQIDWDNFQPKSAAEIRLIGLEIMTRMIQNTRDNREALYTIQHHITPTPSPQYTWDCLWIGYQLRNRWLLFTSMPCNDATSKALAEDLNNIYALVKTISNKHLSQVIRKSLGLVHSHNNAAVSFFGYQTQSQQQGDRQAALPKP